MIDIELLSPMLSTDQINLAIHSDEAVIYTKYQRFGCQKLNA